MIWNEKLKIIVSDVDDTIVPVRNFVDKLMAEKLEVLLKKNIFLFLISGQSITNIVERFVRFIDPQYRKNIIVGHCNGAEVYCFDKNGALVEQPIYSILDETDVDFHAAYSIFKKIEEEFKLKYYFYNNASEFNNNAGHSKCNVMADNRHVQFSLVFTNGVNFDNFEDIRYAIVDYANFEFLKHNIDFNAKIVDTCAIDFNVTGVNKGEAVRKIMNMKYFGRTFNSNEIEVWGDSFTSEFGGSDLLISKALPKDVRTISFRKMKESDKDGTVNLCVWNGEYSLSEGLNEYLENVF